MKRFRRRVESDTAFIMFGIAFNAVIAIYIVIMLSGILDK